MLPGYDGCAGIRIAVRFSGLGADKQWEWDHNLLLTRFFSFQTSTHIPPTMMRERPSVSTSQLTNKATHSNARLGFAQKRAKLRKGRGSQGSLIISHLSPITRVSLGSLIISHLFFSPFRFHRLADVYGRIKSRTAQGHFRALIEPLSP